MNNAHRQQLLALLEAYQKGKPLFVNVPWDTKAAGAVFAETARTLQVMDENLLQALTPGVLRVILLNAVTFCSATDRPAEMVVNDLLCRYARALSQHNPVKTKNAPAIA